MEARPKRSSLKQRNPLDINDIMKCKNKKRNSVSWNMGVRSFNLNQIKANFDNIENSKKDNESQEKFNEKKKKSIKNEFTLVKEMMMKNKGIEEIEDDDEIKVNTERNIEFGKNALNEKETDSESEKV